MRIQIVFGFVAALMMTSAALAQRRTLPAAPGEAGAAITLQVAGQPYRFEGRAECQNEPHGYIYSVPAGLWSVHQSDGQRSLSLTLWRPTNGSADMFNLSVRAGGKSYSVNTVREPGQTAVRGSGKVTVTTSGPAATFTINATSTSGAAITGTVRCTGFSGIEAVGG